MTAAGIGKANRALGCLNRQIENSAMLHISQL